MSNTHEVVEAILKEDLFTAKKLIHKNLMEKLGNALEEKLVDFAPTVFNEGTYKLEGKNRKVQTDEKGKKKKPVFIANKKEDKEKKSKKDESVEFDSDSYIEEKTLSPKQKAIARKAPPHDKIDGKDFKKLRAEKNENYESDEELSEINEAFKEELASIVEEIENETGESLTEEEIAEVANELLNALYEEEEEKGNLEDEEDEDEDEEPKKTRGEVEY